MSKKPDGITEFLNRAKLFENYHDDPEQYHKIFTELGFSYVADDCDGYCPECPINSTCEVYHEIKDDWKKEE
jgi:hypothetical protein